MQVSGNITDTGTMVQTSDPVANCDDFVTFWIADETRPVTPNEISVDGLSVCLERDTLACRGLAPVLLGLLVD
jgi:phosphatidylserine decarboxylase